MNIKYLSIIFFILSASLSFATDNLLEVFCQRETKVRFTGDLLYAEDLSAIAKLGDDFLLIGSDEGTSLQVLKKVSDNEYRVYRTLGLMGSKEYDFEGISVFGNTVYVTGSYSFKRKKVKQNLTHAENQKRVLKVSANESTWITFKLVFDLKSTELLSATRYNFRDVFKGAPLLNRFLDIPAKENGLDVEGVAYRGDGHVYFGLRSPVIRGEQDNLALVLKAHEKVLQASYILNEGDLEVLFVDLNGLAIRDIQPSKNGFIILAGPNDQSRTGFSVWFWNGKDMLPGSGGPGGEATKLNHLSHVSGARAEGITILEESRESIKVMVIYDGVNGGDPEVYDLRFF